MFNAAFETKLLPLAVIDVSEFRSDRPVVTPAKPAARPRAVKAVEANIVRLIPGITRLPLGRPAR